MSVLDLTPMSSVEAFIDAERAQVLVVEPELGVLFRVYDATTGALRDEILKHSHRRVEARIGTSGAGSEVLLRAYDRSDLDSVLVDQPSELYEPLMFTHLDSEYTVNWVTHMGAQYKLNTSRLALSLDSAARIGRRAWMAQTPDLTRRLILFGGAGVALREASASMRLEAGAQ